MSPPEDDYQSRLHTKEQFSERRLTTESDVSTGFIIFTDTTPRKCKKKAEFLPGICSRIKYGLVWHKAMFPGQAIHSQAFQEDG